MPAIANTIVVVQRILHSIAIVIAAIFGAYYWWLMLIDISVEKFSTSTVIFCSLFSGSLLCLLRKPFHRFFRYVATFAFVAQACDSLYVLYVVGAPAIEDEPSLVEGFSGFFLIFVLIPLLSGIAAILSGRFKDAVKT